MKKHNTVKVVLIAVLAFLVLSWILPAAYYSSQYVDQGRVQMGLYELFNYPLTALSYFGYITMFIIFIGGFYGVLYKIPAYRTFLDKIVSIFEGKESIFISVVIVLLSACVSVCGLQVGVAMFIPLVVSIILLMGYDKIVAALVTVGSIAAGLAGCTLAYSNLNILTSILSLKGNFQMGVRFIILLVGMALVIFNTLMYIKNNLKNKKISSASNSKEKKVEKVVLEDSTTSQKSASKTTKTTKTSKGKKSSSNSKSGKKSSKSGRNANKAALKDDNIIVVKESITDDSDNDLYLIPTRVEATHKIWPFVAGFILLFVLSVMAFMSWGEGGFELTTFEEMTKSVSEFKLFGFPIFGKLYGTMNAFGTWTIIDMFLPLSLLLLVLILIYKISIDEVFDGFVSGVKRALAPAFISILVYTVLVLVTYHPFQLTIYKSLLSIGKGFNIVTTMLVAMLASLFNSDVSYVYQSSLPYYVSKITNADHYKNVAIIFQSMYGFTSLFVPTSLGLMCVLSYLGVSYKEWLKNVWKLLLEFFIILLIIFIILALM